MTLIFILRLYDDLRIGWKLVFNLLVLIKKKKKGGGNPKPNNLRVPQNDFKNLSFTLISQQLNTRHNAKDQFDA